jgi:Xaa-Pro aminopeptidase
MIFFQPVEYDIILQNIIPLWKNKMQFGENSSLTLTSHSELHRQRMERLRMEARKHALDGALVYSWRRGVLGWFCGYSPGLLTNYAALWIPAEGEPVLAVRQAADGDRAQQASGLPVRSGLAPEDLLPASVHRVGLVGGDFFIDETPLSLMVAAQVRQIELVDLKQKVDEWRLFKAPAELEALNQAAATGDMALRAAGETAAPGETDFAIAARVEAAARSAGAFRATCLVGIGDGEVLGEANGKQVGPSDPVRLEIHLQTGSAVTQMNSTLLPETPLPHQRRALEVCRAVRQTLITSLQPGTLIDTVVANGERHLATLSLFNAREFDFGHGIGADAPEHPGLVYGTHRKIEAGMVLFVRVAVRSPGAETACVGRPVYIDENGAHEFRY